MPALEKMYRPITASPFQNDDTYCEIAPCDALKPYIRCFWGTRLPLVADAGGEGLVIPDTCMDIIFDINYIQNRCDGCFCAIDERSFASVGEGGGDVVATFAIRFYAWSAILFAERDMRGSKNGFFPVEEFYGALKAELQPLLFDVPALCDKVRAAEAFLLKRLCESRMNSDMMNAVYYMVSSCGRARISDICGYSAVSEKTLERLFNYNMGISPKSFSSLVRYQLLWQELALRGGLSVLDAVEKYGYADQAHLLNDFRRRHTMSPQRALQTARRR